MRPQALRSIRLCWLVLPALGAWYSSSSPLLTPPKIWVFLLLSWKLLLTLALALLENEFCSAMHGGGGEGVTRSCSHMHRPGILPQEALGDPRVSSGELSASMTSVSIRCHGKVQHRLCTLPPAPDCGWQLGPLWQTKVLWNWIAAGTNLGKTWWRVIAITT